ncbi:hypothetical protein MBRA_22710 [Mycobacterium branderi]|uniref:Uncharacterized protein n=1 Tax=Mycobacterium branderi TaxID=43348 RepID=A0ABM7KLU1_9MYCO|nr:hypothetical protein MBRA_22710 [Mycobacterium branderi]
MPWPTSAAVTNEADQYHRGDDTGIHQMRRGTKHAAAHALHTIATANDDRARTMHTVAAATARKPGADTPPKTAPAKSPTNASSTPASRPLGASTAAAVAAARDTGSNCERGEQLQATEPETVLCYRSRRGLGSSTRNTFTGRPRIGIARTAPVSCQDNDCDPSLSAQPPLR